jgi:predicted alpha/beta superfamily hydrolase
MKNLLQTIPLWVMAACLSAGTTARAGQAPVDTLKSQPVIIGQQYTIHSKACGNDRTVMVSLPSGYDENKTRRYPVLIAVDGQWLFDLSGVAAGGLSGNGFMYPMIVVGVHTLARRDFYLLPERDPASKSGGGADSLLAFIRDELIPFVDGRYRTLPTRVLAGTSYGGVFVMHAFLSDPGLFDAYLTLSPSMWWHDGLMLRRTEAFLKSKVELRKVLYLTVANEGQGMGVNALSEILKRTAPKGLAWRFDEYLNEVHGTITYKGIYDGLKFAFSDWRSDPVRFESKGDLLAAGDTVKVALASTGQEIRYTLDGSDPSETSALYEKPLLVTRPVTIKALPVFSLGIPGNPDSLRLNFLPNLKAETKTPKRVTGLRYAYTEGNWDVLPDLSALKPSATGVATDFEMAPRKRDIYFSMVYTGYLEAPKSGVFRFYMASDDGSRLEIGGKTVISNDGLHGMEVKTGKAYLEKGLHRITLPFFQKEGGFGIQLEYESDGLPRQGIPLSAFSCPEK